MSAPAAGNAPEELRQAEVLTTRKIERNATSYIADEVLDPITSAERRLASTRFDTRHAPPSRPVPERPAQDRPYAEDHRDRHLPSRESQVMTSAQSGARMEP